MRAALELGRWVFLAPIAYLNAARFMGKRTGADEMSKISLSLVAVVVVLTAMFASSRIVRAQSAQRFEYVRVTPYMARIPVGANGVQERIGYRACVARTSEWECREFPPTEPSAEPLRNALVNLGNDGWELVSAVEEYPSFGTQFGTNGLTYLFKRQVR